MKKYELKEYPETYLCIKKEKHNKHPFTIFKHHTTDCVSHVSLSKNEMLLLKKYIDSEILKLNIQNGIEKEMISREELKNWIDAHNKALKKEQLVGTDKAIYIMGQKEMLRCLSNYLTR